MLSQCVVVIAYIGLSLSTIAVLTAVVSIYNLNDYIQNTYAPNSPEVFLYYKTAGLIFLTAFATLNFLNLASCISLIIGTLKKKKSCLVPYLVLTSVYILIYLALGSWFFMNLTVENSLRNGIIAAIVFAINVYCLIIVTSLYRLLKLREENYPAFLRETNRQHYQQPHYETTYVKIP
ncbi:hypothetical protein PVAND_007283 [Polypedilum vanderplanki]|uniref:Uncharacterized protein n=1 Tax=Polypedilum vanderplanki TaxID=319348 RepID=A0A9J6C6P9_POLVA|nr:hypothetical protein PVAND_007283 [Polypedilum vanderplanki]